MTHLIEQTGININAAERTGLWELVGNTPLVPIKNLFAGRISGEVDIYAKAEWFNPSGSVKDRPAAAILEQARKSGALADGRIFLDSTSGNMGIAYATLGATLGIPIELTIPSNATPERLAILRSFGVIVTLTDPLEGSEGAHEVALGMAANHPDRYHYADQYSNPSNWQAHYASTGPEIFEQTRGSVTHFVAGMGTTGTITGTGRYLKEQNPDIRIVGVQPDGPFHGLEGLKHLPSTPTPAIFDPSVVDEVRHIATEPAYKMVRELARVEGLFVGISAAAAILAAFEVARDLGEGTLVVLLPDSGAKYLSQPFWGQE
ncbi:MAG: cysteine synthase family protein [Anaerolineales bacterium]|nr:cysteine synthase family protein [Anaerolineales bacterium]